MNKSQQAPATLTPPGPPPPGAGELLVDSPGVLRPLLRLALPVLVEQLLNFLVVISDTALAGRYLEQQHVAAMTMVAYVMWLIPVLFATVGIGATALIARFYGARDFRMATRVANQAMLLGLGFCAGIFVVFWFWTDPLLRLLRLDEATIPLVDRYLSYILPILPAVMLLQVGPACLRGAGDTVSGMVAMGVVNAVNIVASWGLVLGWFGTTWGWDGLALGTAIGHVIGAAIILVLLLRGRMGLHLRLEQMRPDVHLIRRLLHVGVPGGMDMLAIVACHLWYLAIINSLGAVVTAAHGVAVRIESLSYLPGSAFQVAAGTLAGQYLGAGQPQRAKRSALVACLVGGGIMVTAGVIFYVFAEPLVRLLVSADKVEEINTAYPLLKIVAFATAPLALTMILSGALRGAGDTRWPFAIGMAGMLGVRIPLAHLAVYHYHLGIQGAWWAMVVDLWIRCLLVAWRFWQGGWQKIKV